MIDLQSPPSSITFSNGGGIDATYGLPKSPTMTITGDTLALGR